MKREPSTFDEVLTVYSLILLALLVLCSPLLACCGGGLRTHAQIAAASRDLLDQAGAEIEESAKAHWTQIEQQGIEVERRKVVLQESFAPTEKAYAAAKAAHGAYVDAIWAALRRGDSGLAPSTVGAVLGAWRTLVKVAESVGVSVPEPPPALLEVGTKLGGAR